MLQVKLLGAGSLWEANAQIKLQSRAWTLALMAYLLLHRGETIARSRVAFAIWPNDPEEVALQNLRRNLHRLSKSLPAPQTGEPWLQANAENIAWKNVSDLEVDVLEYERLRDDPQTLERAVELYRGDLLEDMPGEWIEPERERIRRLHLDDLAELVKSLRTKRQLSAAANYALRLLSLDPWREDAVRQLMAIRYEAGDAAGALSTFESFARKLRAEIAAEPMPETVMLRDAIAAGSEIELAAASETPQSARPAPLVRIVGRDDELARLLEAWRQAAEGSGRLILLRGAAGIGKSRLAYEISVAAQAQGARVLEGVTGSPEESPYQAVTIALRQAAPLLAASKLSAPALAAVAELVPEVRSRRPDLPRLPELDDPSQKRRLFDALSQAFIDLARPRPLLLLLEDLHWAGNATIELVASLAQHCSAHRFAILATFRDDEITPDAPVRALERAAPGEAAPERISLRPLSDRAVGELVREIAPRSSFLRDAVPAIFERSEGNPLFVTELVREALRSASPAFEIPSNITSLIESRIERLTTTTRAVAEVAAVAGGGFTLDVVRDVSGLQESEVAGAIDELLDLQLVRESSERGRFDYTFTHNLIHHAIYNGVPRQARIHRHRRVARILDRGERTGDRVREIATHYERGGDAGHAAERYASAATRAGELFGNAEARELAERALALERENLELRFAMLLLRARMSARLGEARASDLDDLDAVAALMGEDEKCAAIAARIDACVRRDDAPAEAAAIEALERRVAANQSLKWIAGAAEARARHDVRRFESSAAVAMAGKAREAFEAIGDVAGCARAEAVASLAYATLGRADEAARHADTARALAARTGNLELQLQVLRDRANTAQERGDYRALAEFGRATLDLCRLTGDRRTEADANGLIGTALFALWEVGDGLSHLRSAVDLFDALRSPRVVVALNNLGCFMTELGAFEESEHALLRARSVAEANEFPDGTLLVTSNLIDCAWLQGRVDKMRLAAEYLDHAPALADTRYPGHLALSLGRLRRCEGRHDESEAVLREAISCFSQFERVGDEIDATDDLALTMLASRRPREAAALLGQNAPRIATAGLASLQFPARHYWISACIERANGLHDRSAQSLDRALAVMRERRARIAGASLQASFDAISFHQTMNRIAECGDWPPLDGKCVVAFA